MSSNVKLSRKEKNLIYAQNSFKSIWFQAVIPAMTWQSKTNNFMRMTSSK